MKTYLNEAEELIAEWGLEDDYEASDVEPRVREVLEKGRGTREEKELQLDEEFAELATVIENER